MDAADRRRESEPEVPSRFSWWLQRIVVKKAVVAETMRRNSLTTTAVSGENCLTVSLVVTSTGRESAPVTQCVTVQ